MKLVFIYILILTNINAYTINTSGKLVYFLSEMQIKDKSDNINLISSQINNDIYYDDIYFESAITAYAYESKSGNRIYNCSIGEAFEKFDISLRSFYISKRLENISFGLGIVPLSQASYTKYSSNMVKQGDGLSILHNIDLLSLYYKTYNDKGSFNVVFSKDYDWVPTNLYTPKTERNSTYMFFINEYNNVITEFVYNRHNDKKLNLIGIGYSKCINSTNLYGSFGYSKTTIEKSYYGSAIELGIRRDFDIGFRDSFINFEFFKTFNDWNSLNKGSLIENNYNTIFNNKESYISTVGINVNKDLLISIDFSHSETLKNSSNFIRLNNEDGYNLDIIKLKVNYSF